MSITGRKPTENQSAAMAECDRAMAAAQEEADQEDEE